MPDKLPLQSAPEKLCILRLSALGDVTHTVPVIRSIQSHWPDTEITWVIGKTEHKLLQNLPGVEFIPFDKKGGWAAVSGFRKQMKARHFDVLMHMQVALRANILSRFINADIRLGWDRARSRDRHHWFINHSVYSRPFQHQAEGFLEFSNALGLPAAPPLWDLPVLEADRRWAGEQLAGNGPILMISACSSHVHRNWRAENYARVADHAAARLGMRVVLIGGPSSYEKEMAGEIENTMSEPAKNLVGKDTLGQSMALMEKASILVSPDSGPVHIASALGTPVLGLYAATWSRRSGPYNSLDLCVDRFPEAARKFRKKEPENLFWGSRIEFPGVMDLVDPDSVIEKLEQFHEPQNQS
jgi:heptosyltransferase I